VRILLRRLRRHSTGRAPRRVGLPVRIRAGLTLWRAVRLLLTVGLLRAVALRRLLHVAGRLLPVPTLRPIPALLRGERRLLLAVPGLRWLLVRRLLRRRLLPRTWRPVGRLLAGSRRRGVRRPLPIRIQPGLAVLSRSRTRRLSHGSLPSQAMRASVVSVRLRGARMRSLLGDYFQTQVVITLVTSARTAASSLESSGKYMRYHVCDPTTAQRTP